MGRAIYCLPLALLFLANAIPSKAQSEAAVTTAPLNPSAAEPAPAAGEAQVLLYDVRGNFSMRCTLENPTSLPYTWTKNNTDVNTVPEMKDRFQLEQGGALLVVHRSIEEDYGNYSCGVGGQSQRFELRGRPHPKLPANTNVVEGQKLTIKCKIIGKPYPLVSWQYSNDTDSEKKNWVDASDFLSGRATLNASEAGVPNGVLSVAAAARADAGAYRCVAGTLTAETILRVKDMYAALWPFLGICAEVFVLCAIILVYERRRTKPETDDSDADTSDQKKS